LRNDPAVSVADPMWAEGIVVQSEAVKLQAPPPGSGSKPGEGVNECLLLGTDASEPPFDLVRGRWIGGDEDGNHAAHTIDVVVSSGIADRYGIDVHGALMVGRDESSHQLRVIGIVDNPPVPITGRMASSMALPSPSIAGMYVRMDDAAEILKQEPIITFIGLCLKDDVDIHAFRYAWGPRLSAYEQPAQFQEDHDLEEELDEAAAAKNVELQSYAATLMAMLLAFLVIFNTLNMGVSERVRQFAMLRAITLTRFQVAQIVFVEGLIISGIGFLGGLVVGQVLLVLTGSIFDRVLRHGASVGVLAIALAAIASFGAALLAALIPAWRATRVKPLDAMVAPQTKAQTSTKRLWIFSLLGLGLISVAPALTFLFPPASDQGATLSA